MKYFSIFLIVFLFAKAQAQSNCCEKDFIKLCYKKYSGENNEQKRYEKLLAVKSEILKIEKNCLCTNSAEFWLLKADVFIALANNRYANPQIRPCFLDSATITLKNFPKNLLAQNASTEIEPRRRAIREKKSELCLYSAEKTISCCEKEIEREYGPPSGATDSLMENKRKEFLRKITWIYDSSGKFVAKPELSITKQQAEYFTAMEKVFISQFYINFYELLMNKTNPISQKLITSLKSITPTADSCIISISILKSKIKSVKPLTSTCPYADLCNEAVKKSAWLLTDYTENQYQFQIPIRIQPGGGPYSNSDGWIIVPIDLNHILKE